MIKQDPRLIILKVFIPFCEIVESDMLFRRSKVQRGQPLCWWPHNSLITSNNTSTIIENRQNILWFQVERQHQIEDFDQKVQSLCGWINVNRLDIAAASMFNGTHYSNRCRRGSPAKRTNRSSSLSRRNKHVVVVVVVPQCLSTHRSECYWQ